VFCLGFTPRFEVFKNHGACVGVTNGSYVFNPSMASIEHAIAHENAQVVRQKKYVTVALLTAMTDSAAKATCRSPVSKTSSRAPMPHSSAQASPPIQLVLANEGTNQELANGQAAVAAARLS
jgi:hypothetical protein